MNTKEEKILRNSIQEMIRFVKNKRENKISSTIREALNSEIAILQEEKELRIIIRKMVMLESKKLAEGMPDGDPTPNKSTGINVLEDLLKKIIPVLKIDFKLLTTSSDQRHSYRAHILSAVVKSLSPAIANDEAGESSKSDLDEEVDIEIGDEEPVDDKFIDIRTDAERDSEDGKQEVDPRDEFGSGFEGSDQTGRNMAFESFKKVETGILDAYDLLSNDEDQELFYDYLIANLKLYFDKFENEMAGEIEEPSNQAYDMAKQQEEPEISGGEELEF